MEQKDQYDFRTLDAWQKCKTIRNKFWSLTHGFPADEKYRLVDQVIRASRSATACIAEGYGRFHFKENIQFCRQARGSLYELMDHLDVALTCGYLSVVQADSLLQEIQTAIRVFNGYIKYLQHRKTDTPINQSTNQPINEQ